MNFVMWAVVSGLCYSGWKDSGSVMPNTSALVPSGKFGLPIIVGCVNLLFYAIPLIFMAEKFVYEGFGREELVGGFTPAVKFLLAQLFKNIGLVCLWNVCIISAVCSVDKEDAAYRILRATSMLGSSSAWAPSRRRRSSASSPASTTRCASSSSPPTSPSSSTRRTRGPPPVQARGAQGLERRGGTRQAGDPGEASAAPTRAARRPSVGRIYYHACTCSACKDHGGDAAAFALLCSDEPGQAIAGHAWPE